jgi:hypothetical protein
MPELWGNLFSINKPLMNSFEIVNEEVIIHLSKGSTKLVILIDMIRYCVPIYNVYLL